jgi:hypothetical protein
LILCEHERGHLAGHTPQIYALKNFKKAQLKDSTLIIHFNGKIQADITLQEESSALLKEIKEYIEETAKHASRH